jgi:hypothetical protein
MKLVDRFWEKLSDIRQKPESQVRAVQNEIVSLSESERERDLPENESENQNETKSA